MNSVDKALILYMFVFISIIAGFGYFYIVHRGV